MQRHSAVPRDPPARLPRRRPRRPALPTPVPPRRRPRRPPSRETTHGAPGHLLDHDPPDDLDRRDAAKLRGIRRRDPDLNPLTRHVRAFAAMMTGHHGDRLDASITASNTTPSRRWPPSPATCAATSTRCALASPCPIVPGPSRATSTGSRCSNARCSAAPAWTCSENAYS
jgi:hypothetical protein